MHFVVFIWIYAFVLVGEVHFYVLDCLIYDVCLLHKSYILHCTDVVILLTPNSLSFFSIVVWSRCSGSVVFYTQRCIRLHGPLSIWTASSNIQCVIVENHMRDNDNDE